jgi:hypothetical protein
MLQYHRALPLGVFPIWREFELSAHSQDVDELLRNAIFCRDGEAGRSTGSVDRKKFLLPGPAFYKARRE